jgi:hypothetical protein
MTNDPSWQPRGLWDFLKNESAGEYDWKKEERDFASCYVCYHKDKEIGFIPIVYSSDDYEWANWWKQAYKRKNLCLAVLMNDIMERHKNTR